MHTVTIYRGEDGDWWWHRKAENGNVVSDSSEGYKNFKDCREMAAAVNSEANFTLRDVADFLAEDDALRAQAELPLRMDLDQ